MQHLSEYEVNMCQELIEEALLDKAQGRYEEALETFAEALEAGVRQADFFYQIADTYFLTGDYERTITWAQNTLKADETFMNAWWLAALACAKKRDVKMMLSYLEKGLERGDIGEYRPVFASFLAENQGDRRLKKFIMAKCPRVRKEFLSRKNKKAETVKPAARPKPQVVQPSSQAAQGTERQETAGRPESENAAEESEKRQGVRVASENLQRLVDAARFYLEEEDVVHIEEKLRQSCQAGRVDGQTAAFLAELPEEKLLGAVYQWEENADRIYLLQLLAAGFFAISQYEKALCFLVEALRLGGSKLTYKNLAAVLCQLGELELAADYLRKAGGEDILALNLLGQIKMNA